MKHRSAFWMVLALSALHLCAQQPVATPAPAQQPAPPPGTSVLQAATQLVVVDVVVEDRDGHPVHGLKREDFQLLESKTPQTLRNFEEHNAEAASAAVAPAMPKLPPGTFSDFTPVPPGGALNILLLDALNTPMKDQSYVRSQLQQYVKHAKAGTRVAIFGLGSRLYILQGFTSDPGVLKDAVEHKLIPRGSVLLDDPSGSGMTADLMSDSMSDAGAPASVVANMQQFEAETAAFQTNLRTQYTIDAFNALGHYLAGLPGRKNLIWFSGSFPINILPDATIGDPFAVMEDNSTEFREMTNLLAKAQVAVYPIDARGLMTQPMFDAAKSGAQYAARNPARMGQDLSKFNQSQFDEHSTMSQLAEDTGGHAFYNTNGLAQAVEKVIDSGSNYYTLTYSPQKRKWNGEYRSIKVLLNGAPASGNLKLSYRHGYYADDPAKPRHPDETAATTTVTTADVSAHRAAQTYARAAMSRGAPMPSEILFKARILPDSLKTEDAVAVGNSPDPSGKVRAPFRRFDVDFAVLARDIQMRPAADGSRHGNVEFTVFVLDSDGKLLNAAGKQFALNLTAPDYARFIKAGFNYHMEVSAPAKGESFLRVAVHDLSNNHFGVVEVAASSVRGLPPPVYDTPPSAAAPAPTGAKPGATAPQPPQ